MSATLGTLKWHYNGNTVTLDETAGLIVEQMSDIFGFPPVNIEAADLVTHGAYVRAIRGRARRVALGIWAVSDAARDSLSDLLVAGAEGELIAEAGGETRTLTVRVTDPQTQHRPHGWNIALRLFAEWPWWQGDTETHTFAEAERPLFFPILPLRVTSGGVYSSATLTVAGNGIAYPTVSIAGPADYVTIRNATTSEALTITCYMDAGESRTVVMGHVASVVDGSGVNRMSEASGTFWALIPGDNTVEIIAPGTDSNTAVTISWQPSYAGAW